MKNLRRRFKAVIFDMDGVITDTMRYHYLAWKKVFASHGIAISRYEIYKREGQDGFSSVREIFSDHHSHYEDKEARLILSEKEALFKRIVRPRLVKGARPFIRGVKKHGFLVGLVTGTSRSEALKILPRDILPLFDASVTGDEVRRGKPHPEPYLKAMKLLGVRKDEALVIENAPFGIRAAKAAGLYCAALKTSLPAPYLKEADAVFSSYSTLIKAFCACAEGVI